MTLPSRDPGLGGSGPTGSAAVLCLVLLVGIASFWVFEYLPITDLPGLLLMANVHLRFDEPSFRYQEFFELRSLWKPYSTTFYAPLILLAPWMGLVGAAKLFLSVVLVGLGLGFWLWLRTLFPGREWQAVPATVLFFSPYYFIGLMGFLASVACLLMASAAAWRIASTTDKRAGWILLLTGSLVGALLSHVVAFCFAVILVGFQWLLYHRWRSFWSLALAGIPSAALFLGYFIFPGQGSLASAARIDYGSLQVKLAQLLIPFNLVYDASTGSWSVLSALVAAWLVLFTLMILGRLLEGAAGGETAGRPWPVAALMIASPLLIPSEIGPFSVGFRFGLPAAFALLALIRPSWAARSRVRTAMILAVLAVPGYLVTRYAGFQRPMQELAEVVQDVPPGSVIQPVITELQFPPFETYPFLHAAEWVNVLKGGWSPYTFGRWDYFPARDRKQLCPRLPGEFAARNFGYRLHAAGADYFLVRTKDPAILEDLARHVPLLAAGESWRVYGPRMALPDQTD